jgi:hypothetical protein
MIWIDQIRLGQVKLQRINTFLLHAVDVIDDIKRAAYWIEKRRIQREAAVLLHIASRPLKKTAVPCDPKPLTEIRSSNHLSLSHHLGVAVSSGQIRTGSSKKRLDLAKAIFRIEVSLIVP